MSDQFTKTGRSKPAVCQRVSCLAIGAVEPGNDAEAAVKIVVRPVRVPHTGRYAGLRLDCLPSPV
jgi:hypothetical protein